jgi:hypothetical protein
MNKFVMLSAAAVIAAYGSTAALANQSESGVVKLLGEAPVECSISDFDGEVAGGIGGLVSTEGDGDVLVNFGEIGDGFSQSDFGIIFKEAYCTETYDLTIESDRNGFRNVDFSGAICSSMIDCYSYEAFARHSGTVSDPKATINPDCSSSGPVEASKTGNIPDAGPLRVQFRNFGGDAGIPVGGTFRDRVTATLSISP